MELALKELSQKFLDNHWFSTSKINNLHFNQQLDTLEILSIFFCLQDENLKILTNNFGKSDWKTIASFLPVSMRKAKEIVERF